MGTRVNNNTEIQVKEVSRVKKAPEAKTVSVPMVSENANKTGNVDGIKVKTRTREQVYKMIEDICVDYRMSMDDVKKVGLLERISGLSTEELCKKSNEEIKQYIEALKHTLKYLSWKLPWQNRSIQDIEKIAQQSNERIVYLKTGRSFVGNLLRSKASLAERLEKEGLALNEEGVKTYFQNLISKAIASGDKEQIKKAYAEAYVVFGDLLNDTQDPEQKALLMSAIENLEASARANAVDLAFISCQNKKCAKQKVARGVTKSFEGMAVKADALGARPTSNDNKHISYKAFANMSKDDAELSLSEMKSRRTALAQKKQSEGLTEDESYFLDTAQIDQYAGATVGICCNSYVDDKSNLLATVHNDTAEFGIQERVYAAANAYVEENEADLPVNKQAYTAMMDKATQNEYSKVVEQARQNDIKTISNIQGSKSKQQTEASKPETKTETKTTMDSCTPERTITDEKSVSYPAQTVLKQVNGQNAVQASKLADKNEQPAQLKGSAQNPVKTFGSKKTKLKVVFESVVQSGTVEDVKKFAESNNISHEKLTIEILNSSNASSYLKDWALDQFDKMNDSMKSIYFARLEKNDSILSAAKLMNTEQLQHMNFNSFFVKQSVENIIETREQKQAC